MGEGEGRTSNEGFRAVGEGLTVFQDDDVVEGRAVWLDMPADVIAFVQQGDAAESIVIARGGTTTFLTPALTSGVKGVITLQGAPESHLGILSREYGIPCLMSVTFEAGMRTARGEVVPADGCTLRMDVSSAPRGTVWMDEAAPTSDDPVVAQPGPSEEEMAQIQILLERYQGEVGHGSEGDREYRKRLTTDVLTADRASCNRDLTRAESNDMLSYLGWNFWDALSMRATEGESGLIPRQEYEAFGLMQIWQTHPRHLRTILDAVGPDGVTEIAARARSEIGTKINVLHAMAVGVLIAFGRGITMGLGRVGAHEREEDLKVGLQFTRQALRGIWSDDGPLLASMRGFEQPLLGDDWIERFREEVTPIDDPDERKRYQHFSAGTELLGFLLHFDNRCGLSDSGPYPLPDGGFVIVRDHFLSDDLYHWADVASELPHAISQAMFFKPDEPLDVAVLDIGTLFTKPANYLKHMTGMAVYARDRWDTPVSEIRRIDDDEMARIQATCERASSQLYNRIASMSKRDKIMAGGQVYFTDFMAPFARAAGVWDQMKADDFHEIDPLVSEAYYDLIADGTAAKLLPQLLLTGSGFLPISDPVDAEAAMPALHALVLRGMAEDLPGDIGLLSEAGLITHTKAGWMLTEDGHALHARQLEVERAGLDTEKLSAGYARFLAANGPLKALSSRWQSASEDERFELLGELADIVERVEPALRRTAELLPRFGGYHERLTEALGKAEGGDLDYVVGARVQSVHTVWMEIHEDFLQTQGISREEEGSF